MALLKAAVHFFALNCLVHAVPWNELDPTPQAILADAGFSPRPTEAPGLNGIPKELLRRDDSVIFPPPANWCGFVEGDYDTCDSDCQRNDAIRKCSDRSYRYCGTYKFHGLTKLFNCDTTSLFGGSSVELLRDFYLTAISSTLGSPGDSFPFTIDPAQTSPTSSPETTVPSFTENHPEDNDGGLSEGAIRGIAIGVSVGAFVIFCAIAFFIVSKRRQRRRKALSQSNPPPAYSPPAMQQPGQPYQHVPHNDHAGYFAPGPNKAGGFTTAKPAISPPGPPYGSPGQNLLSPPSSEYQRQSMASSGGTPTEFYKPPSPGFTEADGRPRPIPEVDGTTMERPLSSASGGASQAPERYYTPYSPSISTQGPQSQFGEGSYVPPPRGSHEVEPRPPYSGPYEMPQDRN
ncbi:MAG: hypothetical protein LQ342_007135 [Letrouitia transgressa]|nr:MAG: hypothetical protein LQ342_007135 [Letrouitia transgressa]